MSDIVRVEVKPSGKLNGYLQKLKNLDYVTKVGFFEGATYPDGTSVAYVAYLNEFGQHNPPRPFLKRTMERQYSAWTNLIKVSLKASGLSGSAIQNAFTKAGIMAVGDVKKTIKDWSPSDPRPNKPATIRAKARKARSGKNLAANDPYRVLHDTGVMISSVKYEVKHK